MPSTNPPSPTPRTKPGVTTRMAITFRAVYARVVVRHRRQAPRSARLRLAQVTSSPSRTPFNEGAVEARIADGTLRRASAAEDSDRTVVLPSRSRASLHRERCRERSHALTLPGTRYRVRADQQTHSVSDI